MLPKSKYLAKRNFIYAIIEEKYSNKASNHFGWQDRLTFTRNQKKKKKLASAIDKAVFDSVIL